LLAPNGVIKTGTPPKNNNLEPPPTIKGRVQTSTRAAQKHGKHNFNKNIFLTEINKFHINHTVKPYYKTLHS